MNLYKGYVKSKGKEPVDKLKGVDSFRTLEEVQQFDSYGGVLADNAILIDIDDLVQAEILAEMVDEYDLNCQITQTSRGKHFTFINSGVTSCGTGKKLACGLTADIKVGGKNTVECLKTEGEERFVEWEFLEDDPGVLPKWLHPVNSKDDFVGMKDGDGRDSALYSYILTLAREGFTKEETRECITIINRWIFGDPMSEEDIERITREDAFPKGVFYDGKTFLHDKFAVFLMNNDHIRRINNQLYVYKDGVYVPGTRFIEAAMIKHLPMIKSSNRVETMKYIEIVAEDAIVADANYIAFNNGVLFLPTKELLPFSPDIVVTNKIPWNYDPEAYSEVADRVLDKIACNDDGIRAIIEESIGYCFYRRNEMSKAFFLTGSGANGKSTFLTMLNNVVGVENKSSLSLEELDERFSVATLSNKMVNTGDDISDDFWKGKSTATFKKLVSGNEIKAEFKGQDPFFFKPYAKFFFSANSLPRTKSKGFDAIKRRLVIIPFKAHFSSEDADYDPNIIYSLNTEEVMKYLIRIGIEGLERVLKTNDFTNSETVEKELEDYELENNPILLFIQEYPLDKIENHLTKEVFREYCAFCRINNFSEMTLSAFSKEMNKRFNLTVRRHRDPDGRLIGIYVKG